MHNSIVQRYKQIGNAVPVSVGAAIRKHLLNEKPREFLGFCYARYKTTSDVEFINKLERRRFN